MSVPTIAGRYAELDPADGGALIPAAALCLDAGWLALAKATAEGDIPVKILARSPEPIDHWYWGRVVHDLDGVSHKPRIPLDYRHDAGEILGYADDFTVSKKGLVVSGALTPIEPGDRASEIHAKAGRGVPYEASIFFAGPLRLEELQAGTSVNVNGKKFEGPGLVIRQWTLRGCAICPYGADANTQTKFSEAAETVSIQFVERSGDNAMFGKDKATDPDRQAVKQFADLFGAEQGTEWYTAGRTLEEARELHRQALAAEVDQLNEANREQGADLAALAAERDGLKARVEQLEADLAAATTEREELKRRIDAAQLGERAPLSGQADRGDDPAGRRIQEYEAKLGPNLGRVAAGLRMPAKTN